MDLKNMKKDLVQIYEALQTLSVKGYIDCKNVAIMSEKMSDIINKMNNEEINIQSSDYDEISGGD